MHPPLRKHVVLKWDLVYGVSLKGVIALSPVFELGNGVAASLVSFLFSQSRLRNTRVILEQENYLFSWRWSEDGANIGKITKY